MLGVTEIFGAYELLEKLGEGAVGVVYRARGADGREVALKLLHEDVAGDVEIEYRFRREVRLAMGLQHPNVVRALDAGLGDGQLYLACELVSGGSVADRLARDGRLTEAFVIGLMRDVFAGLEAIHRAGLIHRDVKPSNLMLADDGRALLSDLGLARSTAADRTQYTQEGTIIGSPSYLAPEQVLGSTDLDIRGDLYAAGIVLYECLAGAPPYRDDNAVKTMWMHVDAPVPSLQDACPEADPDLHALCTALLQKDPDDRPATPVEAAAMLPAAAFPKTIDESKGASAFPKTIIDGGGAFKHEIGDTTYAREVEAAEDIAYRGASGTPTHIAVRTLSSAELSLEQPLESAKDGDVSAPSRVKLVAGNDTLFLYGGSRLQMGRDGLERGDQDVCLRLRPAAGHEERIRRISRAHLRLFVQDGRGRVVDLETTTGTTLNGKPLAGGAAQLLEGCSDLGVAGVLKLRVRVVAAPTTATPVLDGVAVSLDPALYVTRTDNGAEHRYALVPGRLVLHGLDAHDAGAVEILHVAGGLYVRRADTAVPLFPGLDLGGVRVDEIRPENQK